MPRPRKHGSSTSLYVKYCLRRSLLTSVLNFPFSVNLFLCIKSKVLNSWRIDPTLRGTLLNISPFQKSYKSQSENHRNFQKTTYTYFYMYTFTVIKSTSSKPHSIAATKCSQAAEVCKLSLHVEHNPLKKEKKTGFCMLLVWAGLLLDAGSWHSQIRLIWSSLRLWPPRRWTGGLSWFLNHFIWWNMTVWCHLYTSKSYHNLRHWLSEYTLLYRKTKSSVFFP